MIWVICKIWGHILGHCMTPYDPRFIRAGHTMGHIKFIGGHRGGHFVKFYMTPKMTQNMAKNDLK